MSTREMFYLPTTYYAGPACAMGVLLGHAEVVCHGGGGVRPRLSLCSHDASRTPESVVDDDTGIGLLQLYRVRERAAHVIPPVGCQ